VIEAELDPEADDYWDQDVLIVLGLNDD